MSTRPWTLSGRLTWWMSIVSIAPVLCVVIMGGVFLEATVSGGLRSLAQEEAEEAVWGLRDSREVAAAFPRVSRELASHHPAIQMAWRLRDAKTGSVLGDFGDQRLVDRIHSIDPTPGKTVGIGDGIFTRTVDSPQGVRISLVLDGASDLANLRRYWLIAGAAVLLTSLIALVTSRFLGKKVATLLRGVAHSLDSSTYEHVDVRASGDGAPEEIRQVKEVLNTELDRIRDEAEKVRIFTAGLAHELRSPIQNLIGQAEVAMMRPRKTEAYQELLASQLEELTELSDSVDNLLTICTLSSDVCSTEEFDLSQEIELRIGREKRRGRRKQVGIEFQSEGEMQMSGNRELLLRGIRNVISNAIDWSAPKSRVDVALHAQQELIVVTVDDQGPGVPEKDRERIFKPFVSGQQRAGERVGYGLGLAITRAAVDAQGGSIEVLPSPAGGARFRVTLNRGA